jgi:hypothetical protein
MQRWRALNGLFLTTTILEGLAFGHINAYSPLFLGELGLSPSEVSAWTVAMAVPTCRRGVIWAWVAITTDTFPNVRPSRMRAPSTHQTLGANASIRYENASRYWLRTITSRRE